MSQAESVFEPAIYADATLAGLATLIPIPGVDWLFEKFFERRIPKTIARRRGRNLSPAIIQALRPTGPGCASSCLQLILASTVGLLKYLSRKLFYFLTVKQATDKVSYYWRQAFLFDYMLANGYLDQPETALIARQAMDRVLDTTPNSVLLPLAHYVVTHARQISRAIWKARRGKQDQAIEQQREEISQRWQKFREYFESLAIVYDQCYHDMKTKQQILTNITIPSSGGAEGQ
jgi:hypothetical protein